MGHSHLPAPGPSGVARGRSGEVSAAGRSRIVLAAILLPIGVATLIAMALLWPRGPVHEASSAASAYQGVTFVTVKVTSVSSKPCAGDSSDRQADGSIPATTTCTTVAATIEGGAQGGHTVRFGIPPETVRSGVHVGDELRAVRYPASEGQPEVYAFLDFARGLPLGLLAAGFALLVVVVARLRGLLALVSLAIAFATIASFILPALRHHENPLLVAGVGATAIMTVILYLTHGLSAKTSTALLGTVAGIWTSALLAVWVSGAARLSGLTSQENIQLDRFTTFNDLSGIVLCGIILAGLGVLNDVTITQASAVWELHEAAPDLPARQLFASGMRIGRDHLASTVYTLAFAYAGAALPALILVSIYGEPFSAWLVQGDIAEEIARTLVASIGLILAIPLTTIIGVLIVRGTPTRPGHASNRMVSESAPQEPVQSPAMETGMPQVLTRRELRNQRGS